MAAPMYEIDVQDLKPIVDRFGDPRVVRTPLRRTFFKLSRIGKREAIQRLDGGTGAAIRSVTQRFSALSASIDTRMAKPRALSIEQGRRPGDAPTVRQMVRWRKAVGVRRSAEALVQEIRRRGVAGKWAFREGAQRIREALPQALDELRAEIVRRLSA